ncbi:MAG: prephenate dehydratase [Proteiniphilum sp.]|mgnify:FL=1|nr:prephenate dehydratase [Proteiniphilum sp.]
MKRVAIQGGLGAYHDIAAHNYFQEDLEIVPCITFKDIFVEADNDEQLLGVMAIENTIVGGLLQNHDLLKLNNMRIAGEHKLRISHTLSALPGQDIGDIKEVISHPMALMQCSDFLDTFPNLKVVEHEDTALAAKDIFEQNLTGVAAVCSERAAQLYNLNVLARSIETNKRNFTRFLILAHDNMVDEVRKSEEIDKASLVFVLPHKEGSLSQVLSVLSFYDINLTRIQSLPIVGRAWEYQFYIDLSFSNFERYKQSVKAIIPLVSNLIVLGEYVSDKQFINK